MHNLLVRQLKKAAAESADGVVDLERLIPMVNAAYKEADRERRLKDHAIDLMHAEVETMSRRMVQTAEARFNLLMDNVGEAVVVIDGQERIEAFNREAERVFGYRAEEVIDQGVAVLVPGRIPGQEERESQGRRKNGEMFPVEITSGEIVSGDCRQFVWIVRDITLRRRAETALRESESRFRDLADSASDWFWESDAEYRLTFVSERIGAVLGVKPAAILGNTWFEIGLDDQPERAAAHWSDLRARAAFRDLVFPVGPPDGKDGKVIRLSGIPVFAPDGRFGGYRGVGADITRETAAVERAMRAQRQLRDAIDSIADAIAVYDGNGRLVVCNQAYADDLDPGGDFLAPGRSFEEVLRFGLRRLLFDTGGVDSDAWLAGRLERFRRADGQPFVIRLAGGRWMHSRECPTSEGGVVAIRTDITPLKRREEDLDRLRRRYELILDSAGEGIVGLDGEGRVIFANRVAGEIIGRAVADMTGRRFHQLVAPDPLHCEENSPALASPVMAAFLGGVPGQVSDEIHRADDGRAIPVDYFIAPIVEGGVSSGAVLVFRDATLRRQYEQGIEQQQRKLARLVDERTRELRQEVDARTRTEMALRGSRERLKGITDSLFEGVLVVDREGCVAFANPSARQLLEWDEARGDVEGCPLDTLLRVRTPDGDVDFERSPFHRAMVESFAFRDDDAVLVIASGKAVATAYACSPLDEEGDWRSVVISFRNIETLKKAQREAVQASRLASVGQLAAGIAHEINTPVQYVGDNLRFIEDALGKLAGAVAAGQELAVGAAAHPAMAGAAATFDAIVAKAKIPFLLAEAPAALSESLDGVAQIARIVLSMKEFSHPGTHAKTMTDINHALDSTLTVSRNVWKHAAEVERNFAPALPPVLCHAGEMNQVFLNLIVNAAHAIEASGKPLPGRIAISTEQEGDHVVIRIADSGTGVPEAIRERIFDPFFTTKDVGKGTGQGLAICRDVVVSKHGGRMELADGREGGAMFVVVLPINGAGDAGETE